jgi:hypothetical protein
MVFTNTLYIYLSSSQLTTSILRPFYCPVHEYVTYLCLYQIMSSISIGIYRVHVFEVRGKVNSWIENFLTGHNLW